MFDALICDKPVNDARLRRWIGSGRMKRRAEPSRSQITNTRPSRRTLVEWPFSKDSYAYLAAQASDCFPPVAAIGSDLDALGTERT
jgi:hypothetical protein